MAEYIHNGVQTVPYGQNVALDASIPCRRGLVMHREGSGILTLRGDTNSPCASFARYQIVFCANIAVSEGGTAGPISVALAINGEPVQSSRAIVTPAAVGDFWAVTCAAIVTVPAGCCETVAVENVSEGPAGAGATIDVANANMTVSRIA